MTTSAPFFAFCPRCLPDMPKALDLMPDEFRQQFRVFPCMRHGEEGLVLWLDDVREPWKHGFIGAVWVKTADEAIAELQSGGYSYASLDHDLSIEATMGKPKPGERTGYTVACWLEENPQYLPVRGVAVHSLNSVGKARMLVALKRAYAKKHNDDAGRSGDAGAGAAG